MSSNINFDFLDTFIPRAEDIISQEKCDIDKNIYALHKGEITPDNIYTVSIMAINSIVNICNMAYLQNRNENIPPK